MSSVIQAVNKQIQTVDWHERAYDLTRGIATFTGSRVIAGLAKVISDHPEAEIGIAFNHKQVACKLWARDKLAEVSDGNFDPVWIVGGWYGTLAALLLEDPRYRIGAIESIDLDPGVESVARTLLSAFDADFTAITADMHSLDYRGRKPQLVINTSCEHIRDLRKWLDLLPAGTDVLLQSNDYFAEPSHVSCMASLQAFADAAKLAEVKFAGELPMKNYTRFMLIGRV